VIQGPPTGAAPARLTWAGAAHLPDPVRERLMGPGARFEVVTEQVLGEPVPVFARRRPNLRALLDATVAAHADQPFLVAGERCWTYAEARTDIDALAGLLVDRYGIAPGERVAIVAANSPEHALAMWAVVSVGGVIAGLNGWWTGPELRYGIELSGPRLIAGDDRRLARLPADAVPAGVPVVTLDALLAEARAAGGSGRSAVEGVEDDPAVPVDTPVATVRATGGPDSPAIVVGEDDPAVILFTSGTTGRPKGAIISHRNLLAFGDAAALSAEIGRELMPPAPASQPATILSSPMFHVSGLLGVFMSGPVFGTRLVFPPPGRWDEGTYLDLTVAHRISGWSGVPTQYWRLLRHPDLDSYDLGSVRTVGSGGAPLPPELIRALAARLPGARLNNGYGMSETVGLGTILGGPAVATMPDSVGGAQPGVEVEVRDPLGQVVAEGEVGEIHLRSASVFLGYWDDPAATAAAFAPGRWYRTGDFGRVVGGMLHLDSRARDLILRGGENIYPIEIEHRLVEHPDIDDAAVIGVDHPELGQEVKAFVVPRSGSDLTAGDVQRWAATCLAAFKVPAHVELRSALPYTDTGKVLKHLLEAEG
jgi:acyl-CoA synthetase (AMP-forming)/AMP-acid ligase II